jgi:hypothetical protein
MAVSFPSGSVAKPKSRRKLLFLAALAVLLYSPKYIVRAVNSLRPDPYLGFMKLNGVQVPNGPYVEIEKDPPKFEYKTIDLGRTWPISADAKGNMILFLDMQNPPSDFPNIPRTGQYLRSVDGKYTGIGDDAAQLTVDGKLAQVAKEKTIGLTLKINGKAIEPSPFRTSVTEGNMPALFAAANGVYWNMHCQDRENEITGFTESGKGISINQTVDLLESLAVSALRKAEIFEASGQFVGERSLMPTANGTIYGQSWALRGIYADPLGWTGRLCVLSENRFVLVPELKNVNVNSEMKVTASGKVGLNTVGNCSYLTRPIVYDHGQVTLLPIPQGSISADLVGLADDGSAVLQARHDTAWLYFQGGKLYPLKNLFENGSNGKLTPFGAYRPNQIKLPEALEGLRVQNSMLSDGSILCQSENEHLVLLQKFRRVI